MGAWQNAQAEAARRIRYLGIPFDAPLDGYTFTLWEFETDAVAGLVAGGNSAMFQKMTNQAIRRQLEKRGACVKSKIITAAQIMVKREPGT